ncbi:hypothetical protein RclHR1_09790001 [Rhizophagus clarus]|uniref:Uncharacterized protein n=1 Tax=Rhizophagus clarus TaxID=94130 RepID=A0A2Z6S5Q3_9GLOM|nr:hypothetical protein RclHR1_09790001 [Rhizophagus clarus]GES85589.1 hypothetical protein RCL_jg6591.t1 [Rhizophagus clarus]
MENFEKTWSTSITELLQTFEAELIEDICQVYKVKPIGKPNQQDRQYKTLAFYAGEQNLFKRQDYQFERAKHASNPNDPYIAASLGKKHLRITLDKLYIRVKDMLQLPSQGNNYEDLELQQS